MESQSYSNELELSVNNFLDYCANYRNLSNYTLRNYDSDLNHFLEYLKSESKINIKDLDRSTVRKYVNLLNDLDYKRSSINRKLSVIRIFCRYLSTSKDFGTKNLVFTTKSKTDRRLPKILSVNHIRDLLNSVDIFNSDSGSRTDNLMYYADGEFMYFMIFLEADPDASSYTYSILMEDGANAGDYDWVISSYGASGARLYSWNNGWGEWQTSVNYGNGYYRYETTDGQEHVALAVEYSDSFTPADGDSFKAATTDDSFRAYSVGWFTTRNPSPVASNGDYTTAASIPEFSTLLMPITSVMLIVGNRIRNKKE